MTYGQPVNGMRIGREAGAASVLLVTSTVDDNRVVEGSYSGIRQLSVRRS